MGQIKNIKLHIVTDIKFFSKQKFTMAEDQNVIISIDDSEHSLHAFNWYINHLHRPDHIVGLAHVYTLPNRPVRGVSRHPGIIDGLECQQYDEDVKEVMAEHAALMKKFQCICVERNIRMKDMCTERRGSVGETLCELIKEHKACSIVMGRHGCSKIKRALNGCDTDYVLKHAKTAVIVVAHPDQK